MSVLPNLHSPSPIRRILPVCVVLLGSLLLATSAASAQDQAVTTPTAVTDDAAELASLVNAYRAQNGLPPLIVDPVFSANTQPFADRLIAANPPVEPPPGYLNACPNAQLYHDTGANISASVPGTWSAWGENIAYMCSTDFDSHAMRMFTTLRNSPNHNKAMLDPRWTHMSSAAARWGHSTVAVNRFAKITGTTQTLPPTVTGSCRIAPLPPQCEALISMAESLQFADPAKAWINNGTEPCEWTGVTCALNQNRTVIAAIDLSGQLAGGTVPSDLGTLTGLARLDLSRNGMAGQLPASLSNLVSLESLDLSGNGFNGTLPRLKPLNELTTMNLRGAGCMGASAETLSVVADFPTPGPADGCAGLWSPTVDCLNNDGRLNVTVRNPTNAALPVIVDTGRIEKSATVASGAREVITITGRRDGDVSLELRSTGTTLRSRTLTVDCDVDAPVPADEVSVTVSCLGGAGRVDFTVTNLGTARDTFTVELGTISRSNTLNPGEATRVTITGRRDGTYRASASKSSPGNAWSEELTIACRPVPPDGVSVDTTCLAGRGRIDVTIMNPDAAAWFDVQVGRISRTTRAETDRPVTTTVTGRGEGDVLVRVMKNGKLVHTGNELVDCIKDQVETVVVTTSCVMGRGRVDVSIRNDGPQRTFSIDIGTVHRNRSIGANQTSATAVTGRPDGINTVVVAVDNRVLHIEEPVISC